jgi:hypothetical protein
MRKFATLALVLVACGGAEASKPAESPPPPPPAAAPVEAPAPVAAATPAPAPAINALQTVRDFMAGFNQQDAVKYAGAYAADGKIVTPGMPDVTGNAGIQNEHQRLLEGFPDTRMSAARVFSVGDVAVVEWVLSATQQNDWMGVKAANKQVGVRGLSVMSLNADGAIVKETRYYDVATMLGQLGGMKGKWRSPPLAPAAPRSMPATGSTTESANVEVVKKFYGALAGKSEADFLAAQQDDVELDDLRRSESYVGTVETRSLFSTWTKSVPDIKVQIASAWGFGDFVVVETVTTGKQSGAIDGVPASNRPISLHTASVMQLKGGKIFKGWTYGNGLELQVQAGLYKLPAVRK